MEWLTQNWIWVLLLAGVALMLIRRRRGFGHIGGHSHHGGYAAPDATRDRPAPSKALTDPVSGEAVDPGSAVSSVHRGRIYYFASRENRDRFEQAPERYESSAAGIGVEAEGRRRHRRGC